MFEEMYHPKPFGGLARAGSSRHPLHLLALAIVSSTCAFLVQSAPAAAVDSSIGTTGGFPHKFQLPATPSSVKSDANAFSTGHAAVTQIDVDAKAGEIFESDFVFARSPGSTLRGDTIAISTDLAVSSLVSEPVELRGKGLSSTISALQSGTENKSTVSVVGSQLPFWKEGAATDSAIASDDFSLEVAATAGRPNVLIPLPAAAWSGLSLMGGVGFFAGVRRWRKRFL